MFSAGLTNKLFFYLIRNKIFIFILYKFQKLCRPTFTLIYRNTLGFLTQEKKFNVIEKYQKNIDFFSRNIILPVTAFFENNRKLLV